MSNENNRIVNRLGWIHEQFTLTPDIYKSIVKGFKEECEQGLNTASASGLATMIPSYVTRLPTGHETGTYLALDIGGSTLRVCAVQLLGQGQVNVTEVKRLITDPLRASSTIVFFDWIADTVAELYALLPEETRDDTSPPLAMGVSWSFPLDQTGISKGTILRMGKGFTLEGIDGEDLATLFLQAFQRKNIRVIVTAIVNDTIGALVAHAYSNSQTRIGFIYGTGVNAAYAEKVSKIIKLNVAEWQDSATEMLVNTEIDIFGNESYLPITRFDRALDASHAQPGFQPYEKMMSGAYLGELVRLVAIDLVNDKELFQGHVPSLFSEPWSFLTAHMSEIEGYPRDGQLVQRVTHILQFTDNYTPNESDVNTLLDICSMVSTRAAGLAAAAMVAIIEQQTIEPNEDIVIGVNGTTFEMYPRMPERIHEALEQWYGQDIAKHIKLEVARDGGSIGAALVAMLYQEQ
ncbi:hypothetical protein BDA99DRAFT_441309 [Phascolomyces articulosus]|uniref:Phosphotransferase n=1 Tax=Phascolomyces articulosus TaxID=60185 RepID=A0AAD5JWJ5_9FUNG|nr:hypothetical protein BDA99DRAFT_441309 [Phascolomyces articulosus]